LRYQVFLDPRAAKFLSRLNETVRTRIKDGLRELQVSPETKGQRLAASAFWRVRIGDYRVIYEIDRNGKKIVVLYIGHRSTVYDDFTRLL
jgi:mRNA interferase RelE/StbE